jgi:hypothetical protein
MQSLDKMSIGEIHALTAEVYTRLSAATSNLLVAKQEYANQSNVIDTKLAIAMHEGMIMGKNEKEREGHARSVYADEYDYLETTLQPNLWAAEVELQLAKLDEMQLQTGIRLLELVAK